MNTPIRVTDAAALDEISGILHDETFDLSGIRFNSDDQVVTIPVRRKFHSGPERLIKGGLFFKTYEKDWMRSVVTIRYVQSWRPLEDQSIDSYTFLSWWYKDKQLRVDCNEKLILEFTVERIDLELNDIGFEGRARIKRGPFGIESGSGRVYD